MIKTATMSQEVQNKVAHIFICKPVGAHMHTNINQPVGIIQRLPAMTRYHFHCPSVSSIFTLSYPLSFSLHLHQLPLFLLPSVGSAEETMYLGTLFGYHDKWRESVPVDCGLEIKNKQIKPPAGLAAPLNPLPPFLTLIWLRALERRTLLDPRAFAPREVLKGGCRG